MSSDLKKELKSLEGFNALNESILEQLVPYISRRIMHAGETIFCQGEPSPYCFGVLSGEVVIQHVSKDKRFPPKVLGVIGSGGLFGESSMFDESPRAAMASCSKDGTLLMLRGPQLREWIQKNPQTGQPLLLALWKTTMIRLQRTSHELSVIYGIGRLLGSDKPFLTQLSASLEFLKNSLEGLDHVVFYSRSPFWEEFSPLMSFPAVPDLVPLPIQHAVLQAVSAAGSIQSFNPKEIRTALMSFKLPWDHMKAMSILPLFDWDQSPDPLQGLLFLASERHENAFSSEKQLVLTSLSHRLAEALSRHGRQEESIGQSSSSAIQKIRTIN